MNNNLQKLKKEAEHIRLSSAEKRAMHAEIFGLPSTKKSLVLGAPAPTPSPYNIFFAFSYQRAISFAMVLLLIVGSTTAYAAQGALPGETLYTVKVNINEPIASALVFSAQAKADYHATLAERRMEEAETLASTGKLDASTAKAIETNLAGHVAAADTITHDLDKDDPAAAAEVSARFSSSLTAHSAILSRIGDDSDNADTKKNSGSLAMYVRDNVDSSRSQHEGSEGDLAVASGGSKQTLALQTMAFAVPPTEGTSSQAKASSTLAKSKYVHEESSSTDDAKRKAPAQASSTAVHLRADAQDALEEVQDAYASARKSLDATTTASVKAKLDAINNFMQKGEELLTAGEYAGAQTQFTSVIKESVRLEALIAANKKFDNNILRNLLWERGHGHDDNGNNDEDAERGDDEGEHGGVHLDL